MDIEEIRTYTANFKVFVLRADHGFCQKAATAGAYVFAKSDTDDPWFGAPISVLKSETEKGLIHLGICACGPKSQKLLQQTEKLAIRGVYYNGLSGQRSLIEDPNDTYIFAKGIAMAPLRNFLDGGHRYTKYLKNLHLYVDLDKISFDFFKDYFGDVPVESIQIRNFARDGFCSPTDRKQIKDADRVNIFALTSPYFVAQITQTAGSNQNTPIVHPTEGNFCCGEGICGACTYSDEDGRTVRRCKDAR